MARKQRDRRRHSTCGIRCWSRDCKAFVAEEVLHAAAVVPLEFDRVVLDRPAAGELRLEIRGQTAHVHVPRVESFDDRYLFSIAALVDADVDLLRLFGDVLADAEFIRQSTRRADFRHYVRPYKTAILNSVGTPPVACGARRSVGVVVT